MTAEKKEHVCTKNQEAMKHTTLQRFQISGHNDWHNLRLFYDYSYYTYNDCSKIVQ